MGNRQKPKNKSSHKHHTRTGEKSMSSDNLVSPDQEPKVTTASTITSEEATNLQLVLLKKQNSELRKVIVDLQKQLVEAKNKISALELESQVEKITKEHESIQTSFQSAVSTIQEKYGIDLSRDKIDLETRVITRVPKDPAPAPATRS